MLLNQQQAQALLYLFMKAQAGSAVSHAGEHAGPLMKQRQGHASVFLPGRSLKGFRGMADPAWPLLQLESCLELLFSPGAEMSIS